MSKNITYSCDQLSEAKAAALGKTIRAYDFEPISGRTDRFVEGVVLSVGRTSEGWDAYTIECTVDSVGIGDYTRVGEIVYVPVEVSMFEYEGRVSLVA